MWTSRDLERDWRTLTRRLQERGVGRNERTAAMFVRRPEFVVVNLDATPPAPSGKGLRRSLRDELTSAARAG